MVILQAVLIGMLVAMAGTIPRNIIFAVNLRLRFFGIDLDDGPDASLQTAVVSLALVAAAMMIAYFVRRPRCT